MFEDSLVESGGRLKTKRGATTAISFMLEILLLGVLVLLPLIFTEALPPAAADDVPGCAAAATAAAAAAGCCSGHSKEDPKRTG